MSFLIAKLSNCMFYIRLTLKMKLLRCVRAAVCIGGLLFVIDNSRIDCSIVQHNVFKHLWRVVG